MFNCFQHVPLKQIWFRYKTSAGHEWQAVTPHGSRLSFLVIFLLKTVMDIITVLIFNNVPIPRGVTSRLFVFDELYHIV